MNTDSSNTYSNGKKKEMIRDVSVDYGHLLNPEIVKKIMTSFSRKEILTLLLRQFKLYKEYKTGNLKISYQKKDDTFVNYLHSTSKGIIYHIYIGGHTEGDVLKSEFHKNKFIFSIAHELSHVRYDIDNYHLRDFELAVDFLALTAGYTNCFYELAKTLDEEYNAHIGYIYVNELPSILNRIEERMEIIYL